MKPKVLITQELCYSKLETLKTEFDIDVYPGGEDMPYAELEKAVGGYDAVLCMLTSRIDSTLLNKTNRVKIFANYAVGFNNIDHMAAKKKGIYVANTPDVLTDATADLAWALLFAASRHVVAGDRMVREGRFVGWKPMTLLGKDLRGRTLGIIGAGRIGQAFAEKAKPYGMTILYCNRSPKPEFEEATGAKRVSLETLLKTSDFVSIHTPLTTDTRHLLDREKLLMMKSDAVLVNTARGAVIDEKALAGVMHEGHLFAAGLDVYEQEPQVEPGLLTLPNVVLLPHLGSGTIQTREDMADLAFQSIREALGGQKPRCNVW